MIQGNKDTLKLTRLNSVRKEIRYAFIISAISILVIELILKNYPSPSNTFFKAGDIYLKFCYSIAASTIFFFINQHLPKEEKKVKLFRFVNNKIGMIDKEVAALLRNLNIPNFDTLGRNISKEMIQAACAKIRPTTQMVSIIESSSPFKNWFEYLSYKSLKIKSTINDLLIFNEFLDSDLLERLLIIEDILSRLEHLNKLNIVSENLTTWSDDIFELKYHSEKSIQIKGDKYDRYRKEHSKRFRKDFATMNVK